MKQTEIPLDLYKVFVSVADCGSVSAAARELFVSQSAISQSIKRLEALLGVSLFLRQKKGTSLTAEGNSLYSYVSGALSLISSGEQSLLKMKLLLSGSLTISAGDTISKNILIPYLKKFHTLFPQIDIAVINRTSTEGFSLLRSGKVDLAFANGPVDESEFETKACTEIHDIFVASSEYSVLKAAPITRAELQKYPLLMLERLSNSRRFVDACFAENGLTLKPEIELGAHDLLLDFAKIGMGIACVMKEFSTASLASEELFEVMLTDPLPTRSVVLCWKRSLPLSPAAAKFVEIFGTV